MDAAKWKLIARRLGILTILGIPVEVAFGEPPVSPPQPMKMHLSSPRLVQSGQMTGQVMAPSGPSTSNPVAIIRPASGGSSRGTFILPAGGPTVQSIQIDSGSHAQSAPVFTGQDTTATGTMSLTAASPLPGMQINPTIASANQSQLRLRPVPPVATMHAPEATPSAQATNQASEQAIEFSFSDEQDPIAKTEATDSNAQGEAVDVADASAHSSWTLNDETLPATIVRPKAKTHQVVTTGQNSSIKMPQIETGDLPPCPLLPSATEHSQSPTTKTISPVVIDNANPTDPSAPPATEVAEAEANTEEWNEEEVTSSSSTTLDVVRAPVTTTDAEPPKPTATIARAKPKTITVPDTPTSLPPPTAISKADAPVTPIAVSPVTTGMLQNKSTTKVGEAYEVGSRVFPELGNKLSDLQLHLNDPRSVALSGAIRVQVEQPELCDAVALQGNVLFVPRKAGTCRMAVWRDERQVKPDWMQITIQASAPEAPGNPVVEQLHEIIRQRYTGCQVQITSNNSGLAVTGSAATEQQAREILQLVRNACLRPVQDRLQVRGR